MINVVYIIPCLIKAGPENVLFDIISNIDRERFQITIVTLKPEPEERNNRSQFEASGVKIISFNTSLYEREIAPFLIAKKIEHEIEQLDNVIIHAHTYHPTLIASYLNKYPTITTIHNISIEDFVALKGKAFGSYMSYRYNHSLKHISRCVAISEYMMQYYNRYCNHLSKILNGVNFKRSVSTENKLILEKESEGIKNIVVSGRLSQRKNVLYIIKELKGLKRSDFKCYFIGLGEEMDNCKSLANDDSRFVFTGYVSNVQDYLSAADVYLSASKSEGMPLSVLEALNVGVPSLLSDIPPHREIANEMNLPSVSLFELTDGELSKRIDEFLDTKFDNSIISTKAFEIFSAKVMTEQYERLYESLSV